MKRLLIIGLVGFVVLCMLSGLTLADENHPFEQSPAFHVFEVISGIGRPFAPPLTPPYGYPRIPEPSGSSYGSSPQNTQSVQHYYLPGSQDPNPFGIVDHGSTNAPQQQSIPQWNQPPTNFVPPVPPRQGVRTNALPPQIPEPQRTTGQTVQQQLAHMTAAEKSRLNAQTDAAFFAKYPQMAGKKIDPVANPLAAQQWAAERNNILAAKAHGASGSTTQPLSVKPVPAPQQTRTSAAVRNPVPNPQPPPPLKPIPTLPTTNTLKPVAAVPPANTLKPIPTLPPVNTQKPIAAVPPASTLKAIPTVPNLQQQRQSQQTQLAQQQQERLRQAQLAQQQQQERQRQVQLAQQQQQERQRQAQLAQQKEQERQRQAQLVQQKEQERKLQAQQLAQRKEQAKLAQQEQERQRKVQLAQQKEQDRQLKAYIKQYQKQQAYEQQQAYRQQQEAYRQQQGYYQQQAYEQQQRQIYEQQLYQQQQQQNNSAEEYFYATHGGRNALTEAAWRSGAYTW